MLFVTLEVSGSGSRLDEASSRGAEGDTLGCLWRFPRVDVDLAERTSGAPLVEQRR